MLFRMPSRLELIGYKSFDEAFGYGAERWRFALQHCFVSIYFVGKENPKQQREDFLKGVAIVTPLVS